MGKTVCAVVVLLSAVSCVLAATGIGRATVHDSHPNKCFNARSNSYFSPGESWPMEGGCGKVTCEQPSSQSSQLLISFVTCGKAMVSPPCYLVEDNSKPYPDCCGQVVCPESSNENDLFAASEENFLSNNETSPSHVNDLSGTAMHFALGASKNNFVERGERNDLQSLEEETPASDEMSFEIIEPSEEPPTFQYATFDDIDSDHERFNEVDAQGDYRMV